MSENEKWLTISEVAALTTLHKNTVRGYIRSGRVDWKKMPGKYGPELKISLDSLVRVGILTPDMINVNLGIPTPNKVPDAQDGIPFKVYQEIV